MAWQFLAAGLAMTSGLVVASTEPPTPSVDVVAASAEPVSAVIRRMGEPVQFDPELLAQLKQSGVLPGNIGVFSSAGSYVLVQVEGFGDGLELPNEVAGHIFVTTPVVVA